MKTRQRHLILWMVAACAGSMIGACDQSEGFVGFLDERDGTTSSPDMMTITPVDVIDNDGDTWDSTQDCDDFDAQVYPGASDLCDDGIDNNCNGEIDEGCNEAPDGGFPPIEGDEDGDGWTVEMGDCDDMDPDRSPNLPENCVDDKDNDCDGEVNQGCGTGQGDIGAPCAGPQDCLSGQCLAQWGDGTGYCLMSCAEGEACPGGSICYGIATPDGEFNICMKECSVPDDCRASFACQQGEAGSVCHPLCYSDNVCAQSYVCNMDVNVCEMPAG